MEMTPGLSPRSNLANRFQRSLSPLDQYVVVNVLGPSRSPKEWRSHVSLTPTQDRQNCKVKDTRQALIFWLLILLKPWLCLLWVLHSVLGVVTGANRTFNQKDEFSTEFGNPFASEHNVLSPGDGCEVFNCEANDASCYSTPGHKKVYGCPQPVDLIAEICK